MAAGKLHPEMTEELRQLPGQLTAYQKQAQHIIHHLLSSVPPNILNANRHEYKTCILALRFLCTAEYLIYLPICDIYI